MPPLTPGLGLQTRMSVIEMKPACCKVRNSAQSVRRIWPHEGNEECKAGQQEKDASDQAKRIAASNARSNKSQGGDNKQDPTKKLTISFHVEPNHPVA